MNETEEIQGESLLPHNDIFRRSVMLKSSAYSFECNKGISWVAQLLQAPSQLQSALRGSGGRC